MRRLWYYFILPILIFASLPAAAKIAGYRVTDHRIMLGQVAKQLYADERMWKEMAVWNGLQPPYALAKGQILVLLQSPLRPAPLQNQVSLEELPTLPTNTKWPSVARKIEKGPKGERIYIVNERAPSLYMIARDLYGDIHMAGVIAKWNQLSPNSRLALGQRMRIEKTPTLSEKQGTALLVEQWRLRDNPMMVSRLGAKMYRITAKKNASIKEQIVCVPVSQVNGYKKTGGGSGAQTTATGNVGSDGSSNEPSSSRAPSSVSDFEKGIEPRNENYWLGDHADEFIESLSKKLNPTTAPTEPQN